MDERRLERARSFGSVADEYERARPGYPEDAVRWLVGDDPSRVVDLGAGTGKLTRELVALSHEVTAVEPSVEMLERLRAAVPGARAVEGSAEAVPLPDASADAVVIAQAFHWFDAPVALAEIARVLRPGGRLGVVWNSRDHSVEWVARLTELMDGEGFDPGWRPENLVATSGLYGPVELAEFRHEHRLDRRLFIDLVSSRSYVATMKPGERAGVLAAVGSLYDEVADAEGIVVPYATHAYRGPRL